MRYSTLPALLILLLVFGCSSRDWSRITDPGTIPNQFSVEQKQDRKAESQVYHWAYYNVSVDLESKTVEAVMNRNVMFAANVVTFLNDNPAFLSFKINGTPIGENYADVDIDVSITHPFAGMDAYRGYDVRGVFIGDASSELDFDHNLDYAVNGVDQFMMDDPANSDGGGPDGYTRWFNKVEFGNPGLFGYTRGNVASPGFNGDATLNPCKYYADGLNADADVWQWLQANPSSRGVFGAGKKNSRNYYLRFPNAKGIQFGYAVLANWKDEITHPANAPEAVACDLEITDDIYYSGPANKGGDLILDIGIWNWDSELTGGVMEQYDIYIESTVLSSVYECTPADLTATDSGAHWQNYHVEITADNITGNEDNEVWLIVRHPDSNYSNDFGVPNDASTQALVAVFRRDLYVATQTYNLDPICDLVIDPSTPVPAEGFSPVGITFDATATNDPNPGDVLTYEWDFDGDGSYSEVSDDAYKGPQDKPTHGFYSSYVGPVGLHVVDGNGGEAFCEVNVDVITHVSKNINITQSPFIPEDIAIDHSNGDVLVLYSSRIRRCQRSTYYQGFSNNSVWSGYLRIDMAPDGNFTLAGAGSGYWRTVHYDGNATLLNFNSWFYSPYGGPVMKDAVAIGSNGSFANDHCAVYGNQTALTDFETNVWRHTDENSYNFNPFIRHEYEYYDFDDGYDVLKYDRIVGSESDQAGDFIWFALTTYRIASRWQITGSGTINPLVYYGPYFGTFNTPIDGDDGLNLPLDITRDNQNQYYVLDRLSTGDYVIKTFSYTASQTTALGSFGDTGDWTYTPARIEGSDYDGAIVVLHKSGENGMISVFTEYETP